MCVVEKYFVMTKLFFASVRCMSMGVRDDALMMRDATRLALSWRCFRFVLGLK